MKKLLRLISSMWTSPPVRLRKCLVVKTPPKPPPTMTTLCLVSSDNGGGSDAFVSGARARAAVRPFSAQCASCFLPSRASLHYYLPRGFTAGEPGNVSIVSISGGDRVDGVAR